MARTISQHLDDRAAERRQRDREAAGRRMTLCAAALIGATMMGALVAHVAVKAIAQAAQDAARYDAGIRGDGKW